MALGAQGAVLGTAFIATEESFAHPYHKQRLIDAGADDTRLTDAFHINWPRDAKVRVLARSEEHTSELQSLMRISYAVFCLKKKKYMRINKRQSCIRTKMVHN